MTSALFSPLCEYIPCSSTLLFVVVFDLTSISVAPNLQFLIDDIEDDWGYEEDPFDYVHGRFLAGAILDWPKLVQQAYKYYYPVLSF
jgi:hypothetical protein